MKNFTKSEFIITVVAIFCGLQLGAQPTFVPNQGQWEGNFLFKTDLNNGAIFFEEKGYTALLVDPEYLEDLHHHEGEQHAHHSNRSYEKVAYKMRWLNTPAKGTDISGFLENTFYRNYILGNDPSRWKSNVPVFSGLAYRELYPGITVNYYEDAGNLKYDLHLSPYTDPAVITMQYEGLSELSLEEGQLILNTDLGPVIEYIPEAYQIIDGEKKLIKCSFTLEGKKVGFALSEYDPAFPVVIDPVLNFSTFSGATSDNWGFTATYDDNGHFYGGGIVFGSGYPTTTGAFQSTSKGGDFDISISKFSTDGKSLVYATLIGGNNLDIPHSMVVDDQQRLIIMGSTGSTNFPTSSSAYQSNFDTCPQVGFPPTTVGGLSAFVYTKGVNAYLFKLSSNGSSLEASTLLGSNQLGVGTNYKIFQNYGDNSRGEVILLSNGNIAMTTSALATDLPFAKPGGNIGNGVQNAIVAVFNPSLSQLVWGSYYGGSGHETGYSVKTDGTDVFICGATTSSDLTTHSGAFQDGYSGGKDGYIAKFRGSNGQFLGATYVGTSLDDQAFFIDIDKFGSVFVFGQTKGNMPVTPGQYANPGSMQFLQKYNSNLNSRLWATVVGSGQGKTDLVPTAFMVDKCLNIYISGWNGSSNNAPNGFGGNTKGLPTTPDAVDTVTDGSDFYFMVLDRDATGFLYGSFYGGTASEHVDGGTSRFSPDGVIYQAVCAGCQQMGFPTTPGVYSPNNGSSNCNLGAIKISLEQTVQAVPLIDYQNDVDTTCDRLTVKFTNESIHGNKYLWDFGNGFTSGNFEPTTTYDGIGKYTIRLVAIDTVCDISDTATIEIDHDKSRAPVGSISTDYIGCDAKYRANFKNTSNEVNKFIWDFGDGTTSTLENPTHSFPDSGVYHVTLIAFDTTCFLSDTITAVIQFSDTSNMPLVDVGYKECSTGELEIIHTGKRSRYIYSWDYDGKKAKGANPNIKFNKPGFYFVKLEIEDPVCSHIYTQVFKVDIEEIQSEIFIPNAFSPNGDGINETFILDGNACGSNDYFRIFNRWGEIVFATDKPFAEFWDGNVNGKPAKEDVYTYILRSGKEYTRSYLTLFR